MVRNTLHTKLCDMLEIEFPIVAFTHCRDVAVAVVNSGAFAVYGGTKRSPDDLATDIKWIRDRVAGRPFGIDLLLPASAPPSSTVEELKAQIPEAHRRFVEGIKQRHNIPAPRTPPEFYNIGFITQERARRQVDVVLGERVPVLAFGLGSPAFIVEAAHARGVQVWGLVGKPRQARREIEAGVDVIIAQGTDAGGHTGPIGTFSLVAEVVAVAGGRPVLAAGGVTTGRHLAAALCLGAVGVWTGTVWLACRESDEAMMAKEKLMAATAEDTVHSRCISGFTMRTLKTQWHVEWEALEAPKPLAAPFQLLLSAEVLQAARDHELESFLYQPAGQGVGFVTAIKPARQVVLNLMDEARTVLEDLTHG